MLRILLCLLFFAQAGFAQNFTSTIRGTVQDADTKSPLAGATVALISPQTGTITDAQGAFRFDNLPTGRYQLSVSYVGYETVRIPELLLESGKENVQQVRLAPAGKQLNEATVTGARPVAFNSVQEITIEQTLRYAATYMDPARVATSFPGVAAANDQANGLVIRGNSPNSMQWRLEGVEIVNPNHLSNAGTFSDRPTSTGGGVNILSTQLLGTSQFLSGPFPAQYGNVNGGILDMHLRNGNDQKTEFTAQASLLGLDFAAEGPFSKKSKASYLVNYRYSFTGLLGALGVKFGGEDIRFQDLSFHVNLPTVKAGTFTVFGMGGVSSNDFKSEGDSTTWETQKDGYNIIYKNKMGAMGVTNDLPLSRNASLRTVVAASGLRTSRDAAPVFNTPSTPADGNGEDLIKKRMFSVSSILNARFGTRSRMRAGGYLTWQKDILTRYYGGVGSYIVQPFASWNYQITSSVTTEIGLHSLISKLDLPLSKTNISVEPRASLKWQVNEKEQFNFSYGLHSQMQQPQTYLAAYSTTDAWGNPSLTPSKSHHFVVGYQRSFAKNASLKVEAYWQEHFNIPIAVYEEDHFSALNLIENDVTKRLENDGTGRNYGVEVSYQKLLTDNYYMLLSGSLYDATYVAKDGVRRDSRFNGRHTFSFTGGKEFKSGDRSTWGVNAKILWLGGFRDTPINLAASREFQQTVYLQDEDFSYKMKDYFRPDLRIYWKKSNAKYSRTLALDLQNVSGTKNQAFKFYDTLKKEIITQTQLGLIPVLSYRWEF
ncbi:TonB-dependent receptor [Dyadobacter chenhuakuii]|uniref:TonB-dependent receptor n=1 Tax=Dyadobacter chenhuakuii TaxID=2909339 RepID=A0ABY4XP17_9BACT|nr:TonB-dependent receptor [Dyadobacter chenhuakuii]MCF2494865.1 TonB-dependent receptor [Dyadobacter chenhuakuii]USJ31818.1 TonB-dependent receptor [Dyadobacter chenhuakuii]